MKAELLKTIHLVNFWSSYFFKGRSFTQKNSLFKLFCFSCSPSYPDAKEVLHLPGRKF